MVTATEGTATPVPSMASEIEAGLTFVVRVRAPVKLPAAVGVNRILKLALWFGARVNGMGRPLRLKAVPVSGGLTDDNACSSRVGDSNSLRFAGIRVDA